MPTPERRAGILRAVAAKFVTIPADASPKPDTRLVAFGKRHPNLYIFLTFVIGWSVVTLAVGLAKWHWPDLDMVVHTGSTCAGVFLGAPIFSRIQAKIGRRKINSMSK